MSIPLFRDYISVIIKKFGHKIQYPSESFGRENVAKTARRCSLSIGPPEGWHCYDDHGWTTAAFCWSRASGGWSRLVIFNTLGVVSGSFVCSLGSQAIARYIQLSPLQEQHNFAARAMHAFSIQQVRQQVRQRLVIESSERSTSCQNIIKDIFHIMRQHRQQLLKTVEQRIQVLESPVGEGQWVFVIWKAQSPRMGVSRGLGSWRYGIHCLWLEVPLGCICWCCFGCPTRPSKSSIV